MRRVTAALALVLGLSLSVVPVLAAADEVAQIVERYTEAIGGLDSIRALETLRKTGVYVYNGLEHPLVIVQKRDRGCREEIEGLSMWGTVNEAGKLVIRAYDGRNAWVGSQDEELRTMSMPEGEAMGFVLDADVESALVDFGRKGNRVELVGPAEVDGVAAVQLAVTHRDGTVEQWYLDVESSLPMMKAVAAPDGDFKAAQTWFFDDYRPVAGVRLPFYVQVEERLFSREYIFDQIEANVAVDNEVFVQPEGTQVSEES